MTKPKEQWIILHIPTGIIVTENIPITLIKELFGDFKRKDQGFGC